MAPKREAWLSLLPSDPRPALLTSEEPFARFVAMTAVFGESEDDAEVRGARKAIVADPGVRALVDLQHAGARGSRNRRRKAPSPHRSDERKDDRRGKSGRDEPRA